MKLLLGSQSPRRKQLLSSLDIHFDIVEINCNETYPPELQGGDIPLYIAREKADAYRPMLQPNEVLITADTIVYLSPTLPQGERVPSGENAISQPLPQGERVPCGENAISQPLPQGERVPCGENAPRLRRGHRGEVLVKP